MDELFYFFIVIAPKQSKNRKQTQQETSAYVKKERIRHVCLFILVRHFF